MVKRVVLVESVERAVVRRGRVGIDPDAGGAANELLQLMETGLHELSQPMTALLCMLEFALSLEASDEMKRLLSGSTDAMERLRITVTAMHQKVQEEAQRRTHELTPERYGRERSFGQSNGDCG